MNERLKRVLKSGKSCKGDKGLEANDRKEEERKREDENAEERKCLKRKAEAEKNDEEKGGRRRGERGSKSEEARQIAT